MGHQVAQSIARQTAQILRHGVGTIPLIAIIVVWQCACTFALLPDFFLPPPLRVLSTWFALLQSPTHWSDVQASLSRTIAGLLVAIALALPIGLAIFVSPLTRSL